MIRDLNISEMERVSGGIFSDDTQPTHWLETTWDDVMSRMNPNHIPSSFGGDEIVVHGTQKKGFFGRLKDGVSGVGRAAFNIADLNGDGDLWEETAGAFALLGIGLATGGTGWVVMTGATAGSSGVILGDMQLGKMVCSNE